MIKSNQNAWLTPYIDIKTGLRKKASNDFAKGFLKLMNNAAFGKTVKKLSQQKEGGTI